VCTAHRLQSVASPRPPVLLGLASRCAPRGAVRAAHAVRRKGAWSPAVYVGMASMRPRARRLDEIDSAPHRRRRESGDRKAPVVLRRDASAARRDFEARLSALREATTTQGDADLKQDDEVLSRAPL
jgi:hypothetical protein